MTQNSQTNSTSNHMDPSHHHWHSLPPPYAPPQPPHAPPPRHLFHPPPFQPQFHYPPPPPPPLLNHYPNPNPNYYSHSGVKRLRSDEPGDDHERRLKLIREHGGFGNGFPLTPCTTTTFDSPDFRNFRAGEADRGHYSNDSVRFDERGEGRFGSYGGVNRLGNEGGNVRAQVGATYLPNKRNQTIHDALPKTYPRENEPFSSQYSTTEEKKIVDASLLLKHPHRTTRPDHIVVILRGFPGSGKSYLAKMLRDLEVENGGLAPRIHTMDDYFMMEVEKIEESEGSKSSSVRGRKPATKIVMEYCYEPEMEEAYRSSMLKAFKKTLDEGVYSFVIVDDRNLRVADFVQFWATAKRSGYEVYLLEAAYKDPAGCAARNIHGFTQDDIRKMADQWEEAPSMYLQLDIKSLLHGDKFVDSEIQEVDMDTGEGDATCVPSSSDESNAGRAGNLLSSNGPSRDDHRHDATGPLGQKEDEAKELGKSKWSNDLDEDDGPINHVRGQKVNPLPGLNQSYRKKGKSVRWGDQVANTGFAIGAAKMAHVSSLVIGPGVGYNLNTNPLAEADKMALRQNTGKMQNILREQLRAEHESFKAVFDKRKLRIGGFDLDEE